jgi:hypothetical protein
VCFGLWHDTVLAGTDSEPAPAVAGGG